MHLMIDLETLGTSPGCAIRSIAAVAFDAQAIHSEFYVNVSLKSCLAAGLRIDADTLLWWENQHEAARQALRDPEPVTLREAYEIFHEWYAPLPVITGVWAHGAAFDVPILEAAFRTVTLAPHPTPWDYRSVRDTRTLYSVTAFDPKLVESDGILHHALHDARNQANCVRAALANLASLRDDLDDLQRTFDLRWNADMRAIERWQSENPDRELTWPDHTDLCVWLLEKLESYCDES